MFLSTSWFSCLIHCLLVAVLLISQIPVEDNESHSLNKQSTSHNTNIQDKKMANSDEEKISALSFHVKWFDTAADIDKKFLLTFYREDHAVEMFDLKLKRLFLSRIRCNSIEEKDLFIGNTIVVFSRRLAITDFANENTRLKIMENHDATLAMIKPDGIHQMGNIISMIEDNGFSIRRAKLSHLTVQQAADFYEEHEGKAFFSDVLSFMTSGPVLSMELYCADAVAKWRQLLGPTDSLKAKQSSPNSIRANFGTDVSQNAAHGSDSQESANRELDFFFNDGPEAIAKLKNTTCCIIKPHALKAGLAGKIIEEIQKNNFEISGLKSFHLKYEHAEEFYEIYKGLVEDYTGMVKQLASGRCLALEISHSNFSGDVVNNFRQLVGPSDPQLARAIRPNSLRAKFGGKSIEENAVHCTDLPEDGELEVEYFFKILP